MIHSILSNLLPVPMLEDKFDWGERHPTPSAMMGQPPIPFNPVPRYENTARYTTSISTDGDPADIYYPVVSDSVNTEFPIALLLQGALVDKADYSDFAAQVASYGFVVVVPNNERTIALPGGQALTGLLSEQQQIHDVLEQMAIEDANPDSPIADIVDTEKLGLLGHSFGGAVGLGASQEDICVAGICSENYTKPPELMAGIFYGASFRDPITNAVLPVNNQDIALGLILGDRDSVVQPFSVENTYDEILNPPKVLITVAGANHYSITNEDNLAREAIRPALDQDVAIETIARWSGLFLQAYLQGNKAAFNYIYNVGDVLDQNVSVISVTHRAVGCNNCLRGKLGEPHEQWLQASGQWVEDAATWLSPPKTH